MSEAVDIRLQRALAHSQFREGNLGPTCATLELPKSPMLVAYLDAIALTARLHRQFTEIVKVELENNDLRDINNVQALVLFTIGDRDITISELTADGLYLGYGLRYNVNELAKSGYLEQAPSVRDRRAYQVRLTEKGEVVRDLILRAIERHIAQLSETSFDERMLAQAIVAFRRIDSFWSETLAAPRPLAPPASEAPMKVWSGVNSRSSDGDHRSTLPRDNGHAIASHFNA